MRKLIGVLALAAAPALAVAAVEKLTNDDMLAIAAYVASLTP